MLDALYGRLDLAKLMKPWKKLLLTYETHWHIYAVDERGHYKVVTWGAVIYEDYIIGMNLWEAYGYLS